MEKQCKECGKLLGKGGDTYFVPSSHGNVLKTTSFITYDTEEDGRVMHFETEVKCIGCSAVNVHEVTYVVE